MTDEPATTVEHDDGTLTHEGVRYVPDHAITLRIGQYRQMAQANPHLKPLINCAIGALEVLLPPKDA